MRVNWAKTGPTEMTAPAPAKAITMPKVIARISGCWRRNAIPSLTSEIAEPNDRGVIFARFARTAAPALRSRRLTIRAEKANVRASTQRANDSGCPVK